MSDKPKQTLAQWGKEQGFEPEEFANEIFIAAISLATMSMDQQEEHCDEMTLTMLSKDETEQYELKVTRGKPDGSLTADVFGQSDLKLPKGPKDDV